MFPLVIICIAGAVMCALTVLALSGGADDSDFPDSEEDEDDR